MIPVCWLLSDDGGVGVLRSKPEQTRSLTSPHDAGLMLMRMPGVLLAAPIRASSHPSSLTKQLLACG